MCVSLDRDDKTQGITDQLGSESLEYRSAWSQRYLGREPTNLQVLMGRYGQRRT